MIRLHPSCLSVLTGAVLCLLVPDSGAENWPRFRGPTGMGISSETNLPLRWSDTENLKWKTPLPGPGSSSPIVWGDRVFVTCYSGYGVDRENPGHTEDLKRHLLCVNCTNGKVLWTQTVAADLPEDRYQEGVSEHGYASNTPVTDGERVYAFFGKTGLFAFDFNGKRLWHTSAGRRSSGRRYGSAASPILYKNLVIVNASEEARAIVALDKATGKEVWRRDAPELELSYNTPLVVELEAGRQDLVLAVPGQLWGMDPDTGKLRWNARTGLFDNICPSVVANDSVFYTMGGWPRMGIVAVRGGGTGDVSNTHVLWTIDQRTAIPSAVVHEGHLCGVSDEGNAYCVEVSTGKLVYRNRLPTRGAGRPFYASVVLAEGKLYAVSRFGGTLVLAAKPTFEQLGNNVFDSDDSAFNASPAIAGGRLFLRSDRFLYCIGGK